MPSQEAYDSFVHLSIEDVAVDSKFKPTTIWLTIKQSKTDPFHMGINLCLGRTESVVCPVKAVLPYLEIRGSTPGSLFSLEDITSLTRIQFETLLSATLKRAGLDETKYNTHSFRIGAATSVKMAGITDLHIQKQGRRKSWAYQSYIRMPTSVLKQLSWQLVSTTTDSLNCSPH